MKNPLQDINVYRVLYYDASNGDRMKDEKMLNDCRNSGDYYVRDVLVPVSYSRSGNVYAFFGFSEQVIGKATGHGYDKIGAAAEKACATLAPYAAGIRRGELIDPKTARIYVECII